MQYFKIAKKSSKTWVDYDLIRNNSPGQKVFLKYLIISLLLFLIPFLLKAQTEENVKFNHFRGNISITNNGISLIPAFSLGRPAVLLELSLGGERLSFDPELRFALDGEPWSFIFWWRYKIIKSKKLNLNAGIHLAYFFSNTLVQRANGQMVESMETKRFLGGEIVPNYNLNEKINVAFIYLFGRSLGPIPDEENHFLALNSSFTDIRIFDQFFFNAKPQAYYLKTNDRDGVFVSSSILLGKKDFPISLGSIISRKVISNIKISDWVWNISLIYSFNNEFIKRSSPVL